MSRVEHVLRATRFELGLPVEPKHEDEDGHGPVPRAPPDAAFSQSPENVTNSTEMEVDGQALSADVKREVDAKQLVELAQARSTLMDLATDATGEDDPPGQPVAPGTPAMPLNHTTLASYLLKWTPIKQLVQHHLAKAGVKYESEFPIQQEERRGLLHLFGRGEGQGTGVEDREAIGVSGVYESNDDYSETGAPSPADRWGTIGGPTPPVTSNNKGAANFPTPDLTEITVWKWVRSYEEHIQNMHPLIIPRQLNAMVCLFLNNVQRSTPRRSNKHAEYAKFTDLGEAREYSDVGIKRKRSPVVDASDTPPGVSPVSSKPAKPVIERSIENALVLLVLALGKICSHKERLPEVVPVSDPTPSSPMLRRGHPLSPMQGSPPLYAPIPLSSALPSPKDIMGRRGSFQSGSAPLPKAVPSVQRRNLNVVPGLDYFATATDILGGQLEVPR